VRVRIRHPHHQSIFVPDLFVRPKIGIDGSASDSGHAVRPLQPVGIKHFLALEIPTRGMLLSPLLPKNSLAMLYAPRGKRA
jgi:hypothetical protein